MGFRHARTAADAQRMLDSAARSVTESGGQLTSIRRTVLRLLCAEQNAVGAYDLLFRFQQEVGRRVAPNTIYRALDFLERHRLAAYVASRRGYVALLARKPNANPVIFACARCGNVTEREAIRVARAVRLEAHAMGFAVHGQPIEVRGSCARCAADTARRTRK